MNLCSGGGLVLSHLEESARDKVVCTMDRSAPFSTLIDSLYEASLNPAAWPAVLGDVSSYLGVAFTTIVPLDSPSSVIVSPGLEDALSAYGAYWWQYDTINAAALRQRNPRGLVCDWTLLTPKQITKDRFYQDFRRPFGLGHYIGYCGDSLPNRLFSIGVQLPADRPEPSDNQFLAQVEIIGRHVGRALSVSARIAAASEAQAQLSEGLSRLRCGVAIINDCGRVVFCNDAFLEASTHVLKLSGVKIRTVRPEYQASLERLIHTATAAESERATDDFVLFHREHARPIMLQVIPLARAKDRPGLHQGRTGRHALMIMVDLESEANGRPEKILAALGLTPGEARIAALIGTGKSPRFVAIALGLSEGTVRTRLKHIYPKLRITRQGELVRLVSRVSVLQTSEPLNDHR